ncbi:hypothetical protein D3C76_1380340 [compost metagenome]
MIDLLNDIGVDTSTGVTDSYSYKIRVILYPNPHCTRTLDLEDTMHDGIFNKWLNDQTWNMHRHFINLIDHVKPAAITGFLNLHIIADLLQLLVDID